MAKYPIILGHRSKDTWRRKFMLLIPYWENWGYS